MKRAAKILVNATTFVVGGGVQAGVSFVEFACTQQDRAFDFLFAVSKPVFHGLPPALRADTRVIPFECSAAALFKGRAIRARLRQLESDFRPDLVYSVGFPSYVRFKTRQVGRYTDGFEYFATPLAWSMMPLRERVPRWLKARYRIHWARKADYFETQTQAARQAVMKTLGVAGDRVFVIPNAPNPLFMAAGKDAQPRVTGPQTVVFVLAASYRHKNLTSVPRVARAMRDGGMPSGVRFILTVSKDHAIWREVEEMSRSLGVADMLDNVGPLDLRQCVDWYKKSDIVFMPTVLETFSATYIEAMAMGRPIVTSDLDFARSTCGDAAVYFDPRSAEAAARALISVARDDALRTELVRLGRIQLASFPEPRVRFENVMKQLHDIANIGDNG